MQSHLWPNSDLLKNETILTKKHYNTLNSSEESKLNAPTFNKEDYVQFEEYLNKNNKNKKNDIIGFDENQIIKENNFISQPQKKNDFENEKNPQKNFPVKKTDEKDLKNIETIFSEFMGPNTNHLSTGGDEDFEEKLFENQLSKFENAFEQINKMREHSLSLPMEERREFASKFALQFASMLGDFEDDEDEEEEEKEKK